MSFNDNDRSDLDWLAFSYAAGELSPAVAGQFEVRLADDQVAREALARAVELCQVVAAAEVQSDICVTPAARSRTTWNHRLSWMAVGSLASLLLAMFWSVVVGPTWHSAQIHSFSKRNLAFAWTEAKQQIATVREAGYWPAGLTDGSDDNPLEITFDDAFDDAPSWMTAALLSSPPADTTSDDKNSTESNS
jgi:hypothetical protein